MAITRIVTEVPEDFGKEVKKKLIDLDLTQKDAVTLALYELMDSSFPLEELVAKPEQAREFLARRRCKHDN